MNQNQKRLLRYKIKKQAIESLPSEYNRPLLAVGKEVRKKFNWRNYLLMLIP